MLAFWMMLSAIAHEVREQFAKQALGMTDPTPGTRPSHIMGLDAQKAVSGYERTSIDLKGMQSTNPFSEAKYSNGLQTFTVKIYWDRGNITDVKQTYD